MKRAAMLGVFVSVTVLGWLGTVLADNSHDPRPTHALKDSRNGATMASPQVRFYPA
jgi:hypothetical protein